MPGSSPLDLFKEEMASEQASVRINAIHRIGIIATLIGPSKVKRELLPMLESNHKHHSPSVYKLRFPTFKTMLTFSGLINEEEDEILFAIAKVLGSLL